MEQVIFGGSYSLLPDTVTEYDSPVGGMGWAGTELWRYKLVSTDGKIKNLRVKLDGDPGIGKHYDFTLMVNGAPSALTLEIAGAATSGNDMVNEIDVTGGDTVSIQCDPDNTPTVRYATWTCVFEGDTANESLIMGGGTADLNNGAIEYGQVMSSTWYHFTEDGFRQVVPTSGTLKNFYVKLSADPGDAPDAYKFTLRKGGISQALTVTITADDTTGSDLVNTVDVVAGDILTLMVEPLNAPLVEPYACWGMTFVADIDGESIVIGGSTNDLESETIEYNLLTSYEAYSWNADETLRYQLGQVCTLKKLHILLSGSPGVGTKYDFTLRIAGANSNVIATVSGAATTGNSGALEDTVALDEYVDLQVAPDSEPTIRDAYWGFVCYIEPLAPGWTGKISGVTNPEEIAGVAVANIAEVKGIA